ncbi:UTP--glucose-1-phosphate uridylyltransferase [Patescibacteria group bacterium]|nr:UTP--glucose-1-phosphate uridylyltransferase [Patescibacteria group bacterium]
MEINPSMKLRVGAERSRSIKKAVIPIAGLGTRFLPLSKVLPKELWPIVDKPVIQYIVEEAKASGISEMIFVISPEKKVVHDYFKKYYFRKSPKLEKNLKGKNKTSFLQELKKLEELYQGISCSYLYQRKPLGDGHAVLLTKKLVMDEPFAVLWGDDVVDSKIPCLLQIVKVFKTCQKPVISLHRVAKERIPSYGIVKTEKIANRLYKIKKIVEKPSLESAPSDLAIVGKYILTPEVFDYLEKARPSKSGEIILAEVLDKMIKDGKIIYGYEFKGRWLECGNKLNWLKSHLYLSFKHPEFGPRLKNFLKELE